MRDKIIEGIKGAVAIFVLFFAIPLYTNLTAPEYVDPCIGIGSETEFLQCEAAESARGDVGDYTGSRY